MNEMTVTREGFPHGLRCIDCHERIPEGANYSQRLEGVMDDDTYVVEIVCVPCALGVKER